MISQYFHTIRHLKFKQIYYRIWFHLVKPSIAKSLAHDLRFTKNQFCSPIKNKISLFNNNTFKFLNKSASLSEVGWNGNTNAVSKLWRYNQHYFDDLNATDSLTRKVLHQQLLNLWANEPTDITTCEANYSMSLEKCDTLDDSKQEMCFDKADEDYSKCLDKVNAE